MNMQDGRQLISFLTSKLACKLSNFKFFVKIVSLFCLAGLF